MDDLEKFVDFIYGEASGYAYCPVKKIDLLKPEGYSWEPKFYLWPLESKSMFDWIRVNSLKYDVYISPALFKEKRATKDSVQHISVAWLEFDGKLGINYKDIPAPNVVVQSSSSTHLHCYWKIPPVGRDGAEEINRRLTYYLEADSSGWDCTQVLRPPTTINYKYQTPVEVKMVQFDPTGVHDFAVFDKAPKIEALPSNITYDELLDPNTVINAHALPVEIIKKVTTESPPQGIRSSFLMATGHLLAEEGLDFLEIVSLLYVQDCRIKKFVGRSDQLLRLSEIASIALAKFEAENTVEYYSPSQILHHEVQLEWLIEGWLHTRGIMLISGEPGIGKTQFCLDLAYRLATGSSVLKKPEILPTEVMFISLEMDVIELKYIYEHHSKEFLDVEKWDTVKVFPFEETSFVAFEKAIKEHRPKVLIIDSLSELCMDEMKELEARRVMAWLKKMRRTYDLAEIVIHHNRKASDANKKPRKLSDLYGSFIFGKLSETVVSLWQEEGKSYLELHSLKTRFGKKENLRLRRSENLTFSVDEAVITLNVDNIGKPNTGSVNPLLGFE
jgi:archaellum biogenesis ATPase FlaH